MKVKPVDKYNQRIGDYVDGFTVHGLTKVCKGTRKEAAVWMFFICIGVLFAGVVIGRLVAKYYRYETYTEFKTVVTDQNAIPSISVCDFEELRQAYFNYCGDRVTSRKDNDELCNRDNIPNREFLENSTVIDGKWQSRLFEIRKCWPWEKSNCNSADYFKARMNGACFTWNYDGTFHDGYGHVDFKFKYRGNTTQRKPRMIIIPHDPRIQEIDLTKMITIDPKKNYEIKIGKTFIVRQPKPYSECASKAPTEEMDVYPGAYDRRTCKETYQQLTTFKECGVIFDYFRSFLSESIVKTYGKNLTNGDAKKCMLKNINVKTPEDRCPFACEELSLNVHSNVYDDKDGMDNVYSFGVQLENVDMYTVMEEQPLYSAEQMSSEIGGFLGLVVGASMLSFIELFACGFLFLLKKANEER